MRRCAAARPGRSCAGALAQTACRRSCGDRQDKVDFSGHLARGLARHHGDVLDAMARDAHGRLGDALRMDALRDGIARLRADPDGLGGDDTMMIWRAAALHLLQEAAPAAPFPARIRIDMRAAS